MTTEILWQQLIDQGLEHLILHSDGQIEAEGLVVGMLKDAAYRIRYQIICDSNWNVERVSAINLLDAKEFALTRSEEEWLDDEHRPIESLRGCTDVDIMVTPFTNTLPIKRLNLATGEFKDIFVVYVRIPDLSLSKLDQRYTRLSEDVYRYENMSSGFTADLKVDENGLVIDYPGIFKMVWKKTES
jgi:hypothetical protein